MSLGRHVADVLIDFTDVRRQLHRSDQPFCAQ